MRFNFISQCAMPPKRKISSKSARFLLNRVYEDTVRNLIMDARANQMALRDSLQIQLPNESPHYYMSGILPDEGRFVGFGDVRKAQWRYTSDGVRRFSKFKFRGKAKRTNLGKRKRK